MSRIRSIHPGLASDETYMSMSMAAKAVWPILWTECDDHGVFEWKPVVLKARILPGEAIDFAPLLDEFVQLGCVQRFEVDGKAYGLVRNFGRFQRPKKPSFRHPFPDHLRTFGGFKPREFGTGSEPVGVEYRTGTEIAAQMKEEGGRREIEVKVDAYASPSPSMARATARPPEREIQKDPDFLDFWGAYPRKVRIDDAEEEFVQAIERGAKASDIIEAAKVYAMRKDGEAEKYVDRPDQWLRSKRWTEFKPVQAVSDDRIKVRQTDPQWQALSERYRREHGKPVPVVDGSWYFPRTWLQTEAA